MEATENTKPIKPLGRRSYGSIGHLPCSRLGPSDSSVNEGQARICTVRTRDKHDVVIVQEKVDGSNVGVCRLNGEIIPLIRAGYPARSSKFEQHHLFADWVAENEQRFFEVLKEGERICGEWLAQAHGTIYEIEQDEDPFVAFDIMTGDTRLPFSQFRNRVDNAGFTAPELLSYGGAVSVAQAMSLHAHRMVYPSDGIEGVVYRVERFGKVDFLAKYVRPDKIDGQHLPEVSGKPAIWNWRPVG